MLRNLQQTITSRLWFVFSHVIVVSSHKSHLNVWWGWQTRLCSPLCKTDHVVSNYVFGKLPRRFVQEV
jgi:hypothetical protein